MSSIEINTSDQELRDRYKKIGERIIALQKERREIKQRLTCSCCGSRPVYARSLCRVCYNRFLRYGDPTPRRSLTQKPPTTKLAWRLRVAYDICRKTFTPPLDLDETIDYAISTLDKRCRDLILCRYEKNMTLEQCGKSNGVSKERARQIINKALCTLQYSDDFGIDYFINGKYVSDAKAKEIMRSKAKSLRDAITSYRDVPISYLKLSTRANNVIRRAGLNSVGQVFEYTQMDPGRLYVRRNCGVKTIEEIINRLKSLVDEGATNG